MNLMGLGSYLISAATFLCSGLSVSLLVSQFLNSKLRELAWKVPSWEKIL
jgi:hypothetical protein